MLCYLLLQLVRSDAITTGAIETVFTLTLRDDRMRRGAVGNAGNYH